MWLAHPQVVMYASHAIHRARPASAPPATSARLALVGMSVQILHVPTSARIMVTLVSVLLLTVLWFATTAMRAATVASVQIVISASAATTVVRSLNGEPAFPYALVVTSLTAEIA
jgi:hypothetical protein